DEALGGFEHGCVSLPPARWNGCTRSEHRAGFPRTLGVSPRTSDHPRGCFWLSCRDAVTVLRRVVPARTLQPGEDERKSENAGQHAATQEQRRHEVVHGHLLHVWLRGVPASPRPIPAARYPGGGHGYLRGARHRRERTLATRNNDHDD